MKRKVASAGRRRGEFSWSMSVKNGREGCPDAQKARTRAGFRCCFFSGICSCPDADGGANSVFSERVGNTRNGVDGIAHRGKSQTVADPFHYIITDGPQVKI